MRESKFAQCECAHTKAECDRGLYKAWREHNVNNHAAVFKKGEGLAYDTWIATTSHTPSGADGWCRVREENEEEKEKGQGTRGDVELVG
jgi:hypothetical protein